MITWGARPSRRKADLHPGYQMLRCNNTRPVIRPSRSIFEGRMSAERDKAASPATLVRVGCGSFQSFVCVRCASQRARVARLRTVVFSSISERRLDGVSDGHAEFSQDSLFNGQPATESS